MTPRKQPGNATSGREHRNATPRRVETNSTPSREQFRHQALRKRANLACDKTTQTLVETRSSKSTEESLRNDSVTVGRNDWSRKQVGDKTNKEGCKDEIPHETNEEFVETVETPSIREAQLVEREKKVEELTRALLLREKQLEVREIQVKEEELELKRSRQNLKNIRNIIDEKQLLTRKLSDMEQELQREKALRRDAESAKEEAEYNVQKVALRLEASLKEEQEKSELMSQCQILGSQLQVLAKEAEMSRGTVKTLFLEVEKWRRIATDGRTLNEDFSGKKAKEVCLLTPEPLLEVNSGVEEAIDPKTREVMEVGVPLEAGRRKCEPLDLLRIQEDEENPKSGSRMDFAEKKVFFQKKIEAEINSPSLRERK